MHISLNCFVFVFVNTKKGVRKSIGVLRLNEKVGYVLSFVLLKCSRTVSLLTSLDRQFHAPGVLTNLSCVFYYFKCIDLASATSACCLINLLASNRNLGIYVDADLSMRTHVLKTTSGCFAVLRRIKSIRRSVSTTVLQSLMVAMVLSRLDYGSTVLAGLPKQLLDRLQFVQNAAAR